MELVIDVGNTRTKAALFVNNGIHKVLRCEEPTFELNSLLEGYKIETILISSVRNNEDELLTYWQQFAPTLILNADLPLPIRNAYKTPKTLGKDRIAAVIGARFLHSEGPILAIDAGTCITYDVLTEDDVYLGGNIAPGAMLRFKAMNAFTKALPLIEIQETSQLYGQTTNDSMLTGVMNGLVCEIEGVIGQYEKAFPELKTVICGGEVRYFVNHLKKEIFANQNLVLLGLHKILKFNEQKRS